MMKNIQDLLENKPFEALNAAEQEQVLREMSEEEYRQSHQLLAMATTAFAASKLVPNPNVQDNLRSAFRKNVDDGSGISPWGSWLFVKVPLWSAILSLLIISSLLYFYSNNKKTTSSPTPVIEQPPVIEKVFVYQTDTIFIEKEVTPKIETENSKKTIQKSKYKYERSSKPKTPPIAQNENKPKEVVLEPVLTYLDTNALNEIEHQIRGQRLDEDAPQVEVKIFR